MSNLTRRNFIGAAGLAAASISLRAGETPDLDAFQKELDAITPKDYTAFQLPGMELPDADRLAAYAALPGLKRYDEAFDKIFAELQSATVTDKPAIWYVYNMGVIVKTPQALFTIDVNHRQATRLEPILDFALITHNHHDHYSERFLDAVDRAGKTVISNFDDNYGAYFAKRMPGGFTRAAKTFNLKDVTVKTSLSDHNRYLIDFTTAFEITIGDYVIYHSGDSQNIEKLNPSRAPDLWIVHPRCGLKIADGIQKFHPKKTVIAHLFELGHAANRWRWRVSDGLEQIKTAEEAGGAAVMPLWGDRLA
ncbi:MAG: MBL fold metallo-hydrolase [Kiritimatiellae bacterium]|nr:MBL fold metallo-hydrolase [Kiritimatiellia bacterium]